MFNFRLPTCNDIEIKCLCCENIIIPLEKYKDKYVNVGLWDNGIVSMSFAHYKTTVKGQVLLIGLCNNCIGENINKNKITIIYGDTAIKPKI